MAIQIPKIADFISKTIPSLIQKKSREPSVQRRVGLNIGKANLVACELLVEGERLSLERCVRKELVKQKPVAQQVKDLFQEGKFETKEVRVSLKGEGIVIRYLSFPKMNRADFASSIQFEAEKYLPFNVSEVTLDYYVFSGNGEDAKAGADTMQVILVAARRTEVDKLLALAREAGLIVKAIDADIFAYANAFEFSHPDELKRCVGLIDLGAGDTTLGIVDKGKLSFSRDIAFGGADLAEMVRRKLNVSEEEVVKILCDDSLKQPESLSAIHQGLDHLFRELSTSLNYYYGQHEGASPIEVFYISGGFSQLSILPELLGKQVEVPVQKWDPSSRLAVGQAFDSEALKAMIPYLPVSLGLAIHP
ncbi:MAG: type IV pilus assembly protein PilM [Candidatus Omnitrophica bacterium]|nr:type IV pilus assembly protein PilM [Candidatus Omnitrophota bacterium]